MSPSERWDTPPSRRQLLRAGSVTATGTLVPGLAGCLDTLTSTPGPLKSIPAEAEVVARVDVRRALSDPAADRMVDAALKPFGPVAPYGGPTDLAAARETFRTRTGLDLSRAETALAFGTYPSAGESDWQAAVRIEAEWAEPAVVEATVGDDGEMEKRTHHGRSIYAPPPDGRSLWLGVVGSNEYVLGTEKLVKSAIAVAAGEREPVAADLQDAYAAIRSAPFRFASAVPADRLPKERFVVGGAAIDPQRFVPVEYVAGATYSTGDAEVEAVGLVGELRTGREPDATDVTNALVGALAQMEETTANPAVAKALQAVDVTRTDTRVRVAFEGPVERASTVVTVLSSQLLGFFWPGAGP